jgi:DNA-3-methyladenine glycosylase
MSVRRGTTELRRLASGPGRLCQAFGIDLNFNGQRIGRQIKLKERTVTPHVGVSRRIGISTATDLEWRFFDKESPFLSR